MLYQCENHLVFYGYIYDENDVDKVSEAIYAELGLEESNKTSSPKSQRWSFPECSDFISSVRSRFNRSFDPAHQNTIPHRTLPSSPNRRPSIIRLRTKSVEVYCEDLRKPIKHRASKSQDTTPETVKENFDVAHVVTAIVESAPNETTQTKATDSAAQIKQKETRAARIFEALRLSPYKENLRKSIPVISGTRISGFQTYQSSAESNYFTERHPSPPSPAPYDPSLPRRRFCFEADNTDKILGIENQTVTYTEVFKEPLVYQRSESNFSNEDRFNLLRSSRSSSSQQQSEQQIAADSSGQLKTAAVNIRECRVRGHIIVNPLDIIETTKEDHNRYLAKKLRAGPKNTVPKNQPVRNLTTLQSRPGYLQFRYDKIISEIYILPEYERRFYKKIEPFKTYRPVILRTELNSRSVSPLFSDSNSDTDSTSDVDYSIYLPKNTMSQLEEHERKIIIEFCHLLEKSKQLFNGLRELPSYGHKQWHSYFGRTFDVYTKLWKFQQQHRTILDLKYGLKRWQIGEIASKIGQLYYHFYLRTSETAYLNEAYSFYYAIRGRSYYTKANKEDKCELMVKKLRYYARFIVVCLLLKKSKLVRDLTKELDRQIIEYGTTYDPDDQVEWNVVVDEVKAFILAEPVVTVIHPENYPVVISNRIGPLTSPRLDRSSQMNLSLAEVLIVGSSAAQVKVSELTIDMYRMLQTVECEPNSDASSLADASPRQPYLPTLNPTNKTGTYLEEGTRGENPHKYLLYNPSPSQILVYLSSGCDELPPNGAMMLYISADGQIVQPPIHPENFAYDSGGLITTSKTDIYRECVKDQKSVSKYKDTQCFHPGDIHPYTRRPLFVVVDSENSYAFQNIPRIFGQPLIVLMSPVETPSYLNMSTSEGRHQGRLMTLFLYSPLSAFCYISDVRTATLRNWDKAQGIINSFMTETTQLLIRLRADSSYISFMGDDFLRVLIARFIFCEIVLRQHREFRARTYRTLASPPLPEEIFEQPSLTRVVMELCNQLQVRAHFYDTSGAGPGPSRE